MKDKTCAVIGLGLFGMSVAKALAQSDCEVLVVDNDEEKLQEISDIVTYAICADVTEPTAWNVIDLENVDVAIIAVSENMEGSIVAAMHVLEKNVPHVIAKAISSIHGRVLEKLGVNEVVYPERQMGKSVARNIMNTGVANVFELSDEYSMIEIEIPRQWVGKNLIELKVRENYHINVVAICKTKHFETITDPKEPLPEKGRLIIAGRNNNLNRVIELKNSTAREMINGSDIIKKFQKNK